MFEYNSTTVLNSNEGKLDGGKRFGLFTSGSEKIFLIDGVNSFNTKYITRIVHAPYAEAKCAKVTETFTTTGIKAGNTVDLSIRLREEGRNSSIMANAYAVSTKPFHFEIVVTTPTKIAEEFAKAANKVLAMSDFKFMKLSGAGAVLTIEGADPYIRIDSVKAVNTTDIQYVTGHNEGTPIAITESVVEKGSLGQGTVAHLIKDLQLPTLANSNPLGVDFGGKPIPGGKYDQYLIEYETPRHHVSGGIMGSVGDISRTSHTFFVEKALLGETGDWTTAMAGIGTTVEEIDTTLKELASVDGKTGSIQ